MGVIRSSTTAAAGVAVTVSLVAALTAVLPAEAGHRDETVRYSITELDGPNGWSSGASVNNRGWVGGTSRGPTDDTRQATIWRDGEATELGTLGGPNSAIVWPVKNERGMVVGIAETDDVDPRDEAWSCAAFLGADTDRACVGFVWHRGKMRPLPTFGGTHGFAAGVNNDGQVVGWAELAKVDRTCNQTRQFLGFRAARWDTRTGRMYRLRPLRNDTASAATAINDRGQVVGISGICSNAVGGDTARHAVLWERGRVIEIGDLGGDAWNTPMALNDWGLVVGFANQPEASGGGFLEEGFMWTRWTGIQALGMLDGDIRSQALGVNNRGQIVGLSRAATGEREHVDHAVIWRGGGPVDLNDLALDYDGHLLYANDINDAGVITGEAIDADGESVAFLATPTE